MVVFEFRCMYGEPIEEFFPIGGAPNEIRCGEHNTMARRQLSRVAHIAFPGSYVYDQRAS